jgi:hypothetical protein
VPSALISESGSTLVELTLKLAAPACASSVPSPFTVARDGFSLNPAVACAPHQRERIERLCRYIIRPQDEHAAPTAPMPCTERLLSTFAIDLSICPDCYGRLRMIADVTHPDLIQRILEHVAQQQAPPEVSAISHLPTVH